MISTGLKPGASPLSQGSDYILTLSWLAHARLTPSNAATTIHLWSAG